MTLSASHRIGNQETSLGVVLTGLLFTFLKLFDQELTSSPFVPQSMARHENHEYLQVKKERLLAANN
jgi:hypothetical protein